MNYDITFCQGDGCHRKEDCHRYLALLHFRADPNPNKKTYISMTKPENPAQCDLFWRETPTAPNGA